MNYRGLARVMGAVAALAVLATSPAVAQEEGRWRATPLFGVTSYDDASALKTAPFVGAEAQYVLSPSLRLGVGLNVARPIVDGSYFPLVFLRVHADTSMLVEVGQQISHFNYMGLVTATRSMGSLNVFGQAGLGGYTFFLNKQVMHSIERRGAPSRVSGLMVPLGVGISIGSASAIRLEARNDILMGFDRDKFNPVELRHQNVCTPGVHTQTFCIEEANGSPPAPKETTHNFKLILGFELVPGRF